MPHHYKHSVDLLIAGVLTFTVAGGNLPGATSKPRLDPADPPQGAFFDQYYSLHLGKTKCGWARYKLQRKNDRIMTYNQMTLRMGRDNLTIEVSVDSDTTETLDGKPLAFSSTMKLGDSVTRYRGEVKNSIITMHTIQGGQTTSQKFSVPADTTMAWGDYLQILKHLNDAGKTFTTHSFDPQMGPGKVGKTTVNVVGPATVEIAGKEIAGIKIVAQSDQLGPFPITSYVDTDGYMLATDLQVGILKLRLAKTSKREALAGIEREDIFTQSFVKLERPLRLERYGQNNLVFKLTATGQTPLPAVPETTMQKVIIRSEKTATLHTLFPGQRRYKLKEAKPAAVNLADTSFTKLNDPELVKLARQAAGSSREPKQIADRLCRFVHQFITEKTLAKAFATASETARSKAGDCTEHAVLLAALARINKIPSRVVSGLVYTDEQGPNGAFGYHMWTQLYLNGQWLDMDPTFGQLQPDATHIALGIEDLSNENFFRQSSNLMQFIGQLKIEQMEK